MEIAVARWLETTAYQNQKNIINRETNFPKETRNKAAIRIASPQELNYVHPLSFKQTKEEKAAAKAAKAIHREELRNHYGTGWKKHLNIPSRSISKVVIAF